MTDIKRRRLISRSPFFDEDGITLYHGDAVTVLRQLPANSVHCCITSPPYFNLRSYLSNDDPLKSKEIGSETTPEQFIQSMVSVFRDVRRVLRDDGLLFLNIGDSYGAGKRSGAQIGQSLHDREVHDQADGRIVGLNSQLLNIPHRVAEAMRQDGWIWRQTIIWSKKSCMPESCAGWRWIRCRVKVNNDQVRYIGKGRDQDPQSASERLKTNVATARDSGIDHNIGAVSVGWENCPGCDACRSTGGYILRKGSGRCTTSHEYVFMFAKSNRYFWDAAASQEPTICTVTRGPAIHPCPDTNGNKGLSRRPISATKNPRSVWTIGAEPTKVRHFASFPSELVRRCLSGGVSHGGVCSLCGAPWAPVIKRDRMATRPGKNSKVHGITDSEHGNRDPGRRITVATLGSYRSTCACIGATAVGATVLDCFVGTGTTLQSAKHMGCRGIGVDLSTTYLNIAKNRVFKPPTWWTRQQTQSPVLIDRDIAIPGLLD